MKWLLFCPLFFYSAKRYGENTSSLPMIVNFRIFIGRAHYAARITEILGIKKPSVRMDSQAKYGMVSRGEASIYLRLPTKKGYEEKIWDHAAGSLIVREAGGEVTDIYGQALDFSQGRILPENQGVAANGKVHAQVLSAVNKIYKLP